MTNSLPGTPCHLLDALRVLKSPSAFLTLKQDASSLHTHEGASHWFFVRWDRTQGKTTF